MAVKIRLTRLGDKDAPFYRLVATDSRVARDAKYIENLGTYNPLLENDNLKINNERVAYWLSVGAQPTQTAKELLVKAGLIAKKEYRAPKEKQLPPAPKAKEEKVEETTENTVENTENAVKNTENTENTENA